MLDRESQEVIVARVVSRFEDFLKEEVDLAAMLQAEIESENPALVNKLIRNQPKAIGAGKK